MSDKSEADFRSPFSTLGSNVASVARSIPNSIFMTARPPTETELLILGRPAYPTFLPTQPVVEYASARGILTLGQATEEMHGYIKFLKEERAGQTGELRDLLAGRVPAFAKEKGIDVMSATGILLATQELSSPPVPEELGRKALGLDLYVAAQVDLGKKFLEQQEGAGTTP